MPVPERPLVLASYTDAVDALERCGGLGIDWPAPTPCGQWSAGDLAGHLVAIIRYYHRLLDLALVGAPARDLPRGDDLAAMNARDLDELAERGGGERLAAFVPLARRHVDRLGAVDWDRPLGDWSGLGTLEIGFHSALAIREWHVHAWDLARAAGSDHRPGDVETVARAAALLDASVGPGSDWDAVLSASWRDPHWSPPNSTL